MSIPFNWVGIFNTHCEKFYIAVLEADAACSRWRMHIRSTSQAKRLCKNVQRLNRAAFHKMRACHIFTVDATMAQAFNSLEVEYIIILLQFGYVK
ncbi:hypothetical protein HF086_006406 [Spodoptera exigua]|uniref:Uncharacterized protein n=1 Tax=Spodoptera exigua TaxID=7107 RepID=A0A922MWQ0_SPOEX|nr:hypothetical protein HF086_006406 [Spodoptera exigua]